MAENTAATTPLLARLWELQDRAGLSNAELATQLQVSTPYLWRLRNHERGDRVTLAFAQRVVSRFPELRPLLSAELPVSNTLCSTSQDKEVV